MLNKRSVVKKDGVGGGYFVGGFDDRKYLLTCGLNNIGTPGTAGFGVGTCPPANLPTGMTPLSGYNDPVSPNYGNYQYVDGSVMCFIPKFYYKIGTGANGLLVNVVSIKPASAYANTAAANTAGYALHRAFIDGGVEQAGFFVDKYKASKVAKGSGYVGASIKNGLPLSTAAAHNPMADLTASGGTNAYWRAIDCAKARDGVNGAVNASSIFFVQSQFQRAALALLAMAHGQASSSTVWCAWYNATYNYPKGCNNNALRDSEDASVLYVTDGYSNCGKTGSGAQFAKTTHNGQECGVADLNGLMNEISLGVTCIATSVAIAGMSQAAACEITWPGHGLATNDFAQIIGITQADWVGAKDKIWQITKTGDNTFTIPFNSSGFGTAYDAGTDPGTVTKGTWYVAKQATAMKSFTSGNSLATDHWGAVGAAAMMDAFVPPFEASGAFGQRFGSGANQVLSEAVSGAGWLLAGIGCPKDAGGIDTTGTDLFGKDYFYQYIINELCPVAGEAWGSTSSAGVWCLSWYNARSGSYSGVGWRCACYPV
ncbi:MAG: hypothetical protein ACYC6G_20010 [Desulfobaccales bacterium]